MKLETPYKYLKVTTVLALACQISAIAGRAAIIVTENLNETSRTFYAVSSTDLIEGMVDPLRGQSPAVTDGQAGPALMGYDNADYTVTYILDTSTNTAGYDITTINTYAGSSSYRVNQYYDIWFTTVDNASWTLLTSIAYQPYNDPVGLPTDASTWVSITDSTGVVASGVNGIMFSIKEQPIEGPAFGLGAQYRELDVIGVATVPEPGTMALFAVGGIATLCFLRKRHAA